MAETRSSRKDMMLGYLAIAGLIVAVAKGADGTFDAVFWGSVVAFGAAVVFATEKEVPVCGALLFLSVRFMFAFAISWSPYALLGALLAGGACVAFGWWSRQAGDL